MARTIGKTNIAALQRETRRLYAMNSQVDIETIKAQFPSALWDIWEGAHSEIDNVITDEIMNLVHREDWRI